MRDIFGYILGALGCIALALSAGAYVNGHITLVQAIIGAFIGVLMLFGMLDVFGD